MKKSKFFKKTMVVMKGLSTSVAAVGVLCLMYFGLSSLFGYHHFGMTFGQQAIASLVVVILGLMGEDVFEGFIYRYEVKNGIY